MRKLILLAILTWGSVAGAAQPPQSALFPYCWGGVGNDRVYYTAGLMLRQLVLYSNPNKDEAVSDLRLVMEYPAEAMETVAVVMSAGYGKVKQELRTEQVMREGKPMVRLTAPMWDIKPGFTWTGKTAWSSWPGWWSAVYARGGKPGDYTVYWHLASAQGDEPEQSAPLTVLPRPIAPAVADRKPGHGVGVWVYSLSNYVECPEVVQGLADTLAACGVRRAYVASTAASTVRALRARGIEVSLTNGWSYSVFAPSPPPDDARAMNAKGEAIPGNAWCPGYVAQRGPAWEQAVRPAVADAMRATHADGFMLDYEGSAAPGYDACNICFCKRCQEAFAAQLGAAGQGLTWPGDVPPDGRLRDKWLRWRCTQGALYVKHIADMAREANPDARTYTWSGGAYRPHPAHVIYSQACSDITQFAPYLTAPTVGTYVYPNDPAKALVGHPNFGTDPTDYGGGIPNMIDVVAWTLKALRPQPVIPCVSGGHTPGGSATPLAGIALLRQQINQHYADGAEGVDFWGTGPLEDGRYQAFMAEWAAR